jgi:hypothetical protein
MVGYCRWDPRFSRRERARQVPPVGRCARFTGVAGEPAHQSWNYCRMDDAIKSALEQLLNPTHGHNHHSDSGRGRKLAVLTDFLDKTPPVCTISSPRWDFPMHL